jgi:hypothetical protein
MDAFRKLSETVIMNGLVKLHAHVSTDREVPIFLSALVTKGTRTF